MCLTTGQLPADEQVYHAVSDDCPASTSPELTLHPQTQYRSVFSSFGSKNQQLTRLLNSFLTGDQELL